MFLFLAICLRSCFLFLAGFTGNRFHYLENYFFSRERNRKWKDFDVAHPHGSGSWRCLLPDPSAPSRGCAPWARLEPEKFGRKRGSHELGSQPGGHCFSCFFSCFFFCFVLFVLFFLPFFSRHVEFFRKQPHHAVNSHLPEPGLKVRAHFGFLLKALKQVFTIANSHPVWVIFFSTSHDRIHPKWFTWRIPPDHLISGW